MLLVRKGGFAVARLAGERLVESKVGQRHVQGRTKAGGQSQQRFARRRDNQARQAYEAAADHAARLLGEGAPHVVTGGDHAAVDEVLADPRLEASHRRRALAARADPKRGVLEQAILDAAAVGCRSPTAARISSRARQWPVRAMVAAHGRELHGGMGRTPERVLFVLLAVLLVSGTSYAAVQITGKDVKNNSLTGKDVKDGSLREQGVQAGSGALRSERRAGAHRLRRVPRGRRVSPGRWTNGAEPGPPGPTGPPGLTGPDRTDGRGRTGCHQDRHDARDGQTELVPVPGPVEMLIDCARRAGQPSGRD